MRQDYIVEVIERFAALIGRLGGLRDEKRYNEAEDAIGDALRAAFGPLRETLEETTPEGVVKLIDNAEKVDLYCALLRQAAEIADAKGELRRAAKLIRRAEAVEKAARAEVAVATA